MDGDSINFLSTSSLAWIVDVSFTSDGKRYDTCNFVLMLVAAEPARCGSHRISVELWMF